MSAARLAVLTALASPLAVVLRRGPSRRVASLLWNRATGQVQMGQWLTGRIPEFRADLSPDGAYLVYFASNYGSRSGPPAWTALSRAPWLRAVAFWPQGDSWGGGGAFDAEGRLWGLGRFAGQLDGRIAAAEPGAFPASTDGIQPGGTHAARMVLRGWRHLGGQGYVARLARDLPGGAGRVEMSYELGRRGRALVSARYDLVLPDGKVQPTDWDWADLWQDGLQLARAGGLWQAGVSGGRLQAPELVQDLNALAFRPLPAPYGGVGDGGG